MLVLFFRPHYVSQKQNKTCRKVQKKPRKNTISLFKKLPNYHHQLRCIECMNNSWNKYKKEKESCNIAEVNNHIMIRRKCSVISDVDDDDG